MDKQVPLPGFRFHPTDEELLSFYLRRKVEKKPVKLGIIREIDIYKYNPWDLSSGCNSGGEKELYFFCKRGRKYKNSIRPNRVTGCGFWKATGIDKSIYSSAGGASHDSIIGLKKTLVFYRGSAGKGTKTDWMMHEFRLPSDLTTASEAEIWTLCRIFKRNLVPKRHASSYKTFSLTDKISVSASSGESDNGETYISFSPRTIISRSNCEIFPANKHINGWNKQQISRSNCEIFPANKHINGWNKQQHQQLNQGHFSPVAGRTTSSSMVSPPASSFSVDMDADIDLLSYRDWEELRSIVEFALDPSHSPLL